jgi:hypothetical protein
MSVRSAGVGSARFEARLHRPVGRPRNDADVSGFWDGTFTDYGTAIGTVGLAAITTVSGASSPASAHLRRPSGWPS